MADGLVVSSRSNAAASRPRSMKPLSRASRSAPGVSEGSVLCVLSAIASAPSASAFGGTMLPKPKCAAQAWSQMSAAPRSWQAAAIAGRSESTPT